MTRVIPKFATAAAVAALLALGTGVASAQSATPSGAAPPVHTAAPTSNAPSTSSALMKNPLSSEDISQINGSAVMASDGTSIGKVSTVLMDPSSKKIDRLVVAEGGVLGVGTHKVALPVDSFHWDSDKRSFTVQKTADDLRAMPEWQQPQLADAPSGSPSTTPPASPAVGGATLAPVAPSGNAR
jgi:sporulation protein YlmC with PRC-barrel domain